MENDCQLFQVNAFAEGDCRGNPAGVCLLTRPRDETFYRQVAALMSFPETAFAYPENGGYRLRWFSPNGTEVDLCGHATLATASILASRGLMDAGSRLRFFTRSGELLASVDGEDVTLDFPAEDIMGIDGDRYDLDNALGARSLYAGRTRFDAFLEFPSEAIVRGLTPDLALLAAVPGRGVIVTARADGTDYDFVSRFFCPHLGIDEDPVTGSAHCALAVYWGFVLDKTALTGYQASPEGGIVRMVLAGDRVLLSGRTVGVPLAPEILSQVQQLA